LVFGFQQKIKMLVQVLIGGGENHRMGLYDMVLVKDNHIAVAGGIPQAIAAVDAYLKQENLDVGVEIETQTLEEVQEVISCIERGVGRVTRVLLDNMVVRMPNGDVDVSMLQSAVDIVNSRFETEASGNVTIETVGRIGSTGVTYISSGALTHSVKALDISLNVDTELAVAVAKRTNHA
jgi:nicotinate-nucleotide pyrophosphorylase (carboxylating)